MKNQQRKLTPGVSNGVLGQVHRYLNTLGSWGSYRDLSGLDEIPDVGTYNFSLNSYDNYDLEAFLRIGLMDPRVQNETFPFDRPTLRSELEQTSEE